MDLLQKSDSFKYIRHSSILSNFSHDGTTIGGSLCQRRQMPIKQ
jgi:hypothetical protein